GPLPAVDLARPRLEVRRLLLGGVRRLLEPQLLLAELRTLLGELRVDERALGELLLLRLQKRSLLHSLGLAVGLVQQGAGTGSGLLEEPRQSRANARGDRHERHDRKAERDRKHEEDVHDGNDQGAPTW